MLGVISNHENSLVGLNKILGVIISNYIKAYPKSIDVFGIQDSCSFYKEAVTKQPETKKDKELILRYLANFPKIKQFLNLRREFLMFADLQSVEDLEELRAYKKEQQAPTCDYICQTHSACYQCPHYIDDDIMSPFEIIKDKFIQLRAQGFRDIDVLGKYKPIYYKALMEYFKDQTDYITMEDGSGIYKFNTEYWEPGAIKEIDVFAEELITPDPINKEVHEFRSKVLRNHIEDRSFFKNNYGFINLKNGVYDIKNDKLLPHSKEYGFTYITDYSYDKLAKAPVFNKFLNQITLSNVELKNILMEFIAAALAGVPNKTIETSLMLYGDGANGKSTFVNVMKRILGRGSVSEKTMTALNKPEQRVALEGKLLNISDETAKNSMLFSDTFKLLTSGSPIDVKKLYHQPYDIESGAKLVFLCNDLPASNDKTFAFLRRIMIAPFNATFSDKIGNIDRNIEHKLIQEMPGIFNMLMKHYKTLKDNDYKFSYCEASESIKKGFEFDNDSVKAWIDDNVDLYPVSSAEYSQQSVNKSRLYENYRSFCLNMGLKPLGNSGLFKRMIKIMGSDYKEVHKRDENKRYRVIYGVKILSESKYKMQNTYYPNTRRF